MPNLSLFPDFNKSILSLINEAKDIIVIGHKNPDGDCIFSSLALKNILSKLKKNVYLINEGPFERNDIIKYESEFSKNITNEFKEKNPLVIIVDCAALDRLGSINLEGLTKIVIDHHSVGESFTLKELEYIVPASPSTTLLIEKLRECLNIAHDKETAEYLYKGFVTDTGFYHFINERNGADSLRSVASFIDLGVSPYEIYDEINDGRTFSSLKDLALLFNRSISILNDEVVYSYITKDDTLSSKPSDLLYKYLLQVKNVKVVLFFKEEESKTIVGFRAKNNSGLDVGSFASIFSGGGHCLASGATINDNLNNTISKVLYELENYIKK